jgi:glycine dehydrogenase
MQHNKAHDYDHSCNFFTQRHIGPNKLEIDEMLSSLGFSDIDSFISAVIPINLISKSDTTNQPELQEHQALAKLKQHASNNTLYKNYIGMGYYDTITPSVIKRNVLENPAWYTAYTPYQAEISQGRLTALLNFQQMIMDLTGFNLANASLLDEATAAAEAMAMSLRINGGNNTTNNNDSGSSDATNSDNKNYYFVDKNIFPQTIDVIRTRAKYPNINVIVGDIMQLDISRDAHKYFGILIQNPNLYGKLYDYSHLISKIKQHNPQCVVAMICDILSLTIFKSPHTMGADIALGSTQRFGIPIGFGGPSAAYLATNDIHKRIMPGRIIGVSVDTHGKKALRMSLQTREQHIRREKATSNICTSQVLLANMASFYAVYHGATGLISIAKRIHYLATTLNTYLQHYIQQHKISNISLIHDDQNDQINQTHQDKNKHAHGHDQSRLLFDTVSIKFHDSGHLEYTYNQLLSHGYALGKYHGALLISLGESATIDQIIEIANIILTGDPAHGINLINLDHKDINQKINGAYTSILRQDAILTHSVFNHYHSETQMMRYIKKLEMRDISLVHSMIPLGSCTMKLNASSELEGLSWPEFANIHPFAPHDSTLGYIYLINELKHQLMAITGFDDISMQPNSGAQGELTGLLAIRNYQKHIGEQHRNICLIPKSAHGTNPATAQMVGCEVIIVNCDINGNVDINDLKQKAKQYAYNLSCLMITYPSTHGVFEAQITQICDIIHQNGGQVYMDGANLNALVGLIKPAELGADVSHINLHKTFAIPHGGGGPGMGPIGVKAHLIPFLPKHSVYENGVYDTQDLGIYGAVSSSPFGSASILIISWMYITMLGENGLRAATKVAILNANYIAKTLKPYFPILFTGQNEMVAHECIIDLRPIKALTGITEVDIAKRLMDYGFHSPTMSFPVAGTLMIEPTESEDKHEIDQFINAMISIYHEIIQIKNGDLDKVNNPLKNAPHTLADIINWDKTYSIELGCFPAPHLKESKVFPSVNRIDDAYGDRYFICNCFDFEQNIEITNNNIKCGI